MLPRAVSLGAVVVALATICAALPDSTYLGCYSDKIKVLQRSLPYVQYLDDQLTVSKCLDKCFQSGFQLAGLEYGSECYCGRKLGAQARQLADSSCTFPCAGDASAKCGGKLALSVYSASGSSSAWLAGLEARGGRREGDLRSLLALVMIVKDEAHTIIDTLATVRGIIDRWYILDTGSTDGTQDKIRAYFKQVPGRLFEEPFIDYGASRNRILDLAAAQGVVDGQKAGGGVDGGGGQLDPSDACVFTLMLSADEQVRDAKRLRAFLEDMRYAEGSMHDAYPVLMNSGIDFDSVRVARVSGKWRYVGRVHEYLTSPAKKWTDLYRPVPDVRVQFKATDGERRHKSQYTIMRILLEDLERNPRDTRAMFYLARTYATVKNHTESLRYYEMLANTTRWDQERYHATVMQAATGRKLGMSWQRRQEILLRAFEQMPHKMDAIHMLAEDHFNEGRFQLAYTFALRAATIPEPDNLVTARNVLLRDTRYLYEYEGMRLLAFAAQKVGEFEVCVKAVRQVLRVRTKDSYARKVLEACEQKAGVSPGAPVVTPLDMMFEEDGVKVEVEVEREEGVADAAPPDDLIGRLRRDFRQDRTKTAMALLIVILVAFLLRNALASVLCKKRRGARKLQ